MTFEKYKTIMQKMMHDDYENFFKALVSLEKNINDKEELDEIYRKYMGNDSIILISEDI